jgi:hypothetical protein
VWEILVKQEDEYDFSQKDEPWTPKKTIFDFMPPSPSELSFTRDLANHSMFGCLQIKRLFLFEI